jgi:glycosyltransferase involved in cell wall biosynthesis
LTAFGLLPMTVGKNAGGPEVYEISIVRELAALDRESTYHVYCVNPNAPQVFGVTQPNIQYHVLRPRARWVSLPLSFPLALLRDRPALYHATFTPPPFSPLPYVFSHHCFSTFNHPEFYEPNILKRLNYLIMRGLKSARLILCVSENVRQLSAERLGVPLEKMVVVHNGVGDHFAPLDRAQVKATLAERYKIHDPYVLVVGKLQKRKNITRILESFAQVRAEVGGPLKLLLAGARTWAADDLDGTIARLGLQGHVIEVGYLKNDDLPLLYNGAELFLFPSLWEGFGIPAIEAMACGTPVVTSNLSSLPEIAGDAALLIDPYKTEDIAAAMHRVLTEPGLAESQRAKGLKQARKFSWKKTAHETLAAYKQALEM